MRLPHLLNGKMENLVIIDDRTLQGKGTSYFQISEKTGYALASAYCYADEYLAVDVDSFRRNSSTKGYTILLKQNVNNGASVAMRFIWVRNL